MLEPEGGGDGRPVNRLWKCPASPGAGPQARGRWGRLGASGVASLLLGSAGQGGNPGPVCERGAVVKLRIPGGLLLAPRLCDPGPAFLSLCLSFSINEGVGRGGLSCSDQQVCDMDGPGGGTQNPGGAS